LIELRPVDQLNWEECANLRVCEDQLDLICSNDRALAEAGFRNDVNALAICSNGQTVGLVTLVYSTDHVEIHRFMIACAYQHKGYGRDAMVAILRFIADGGGRSVIIKFLHWNARAEELYRGSGFRDTGTSEGSEKVYALTLDGGSA